MENKDDNDIFEDICNIARVLPNLTASAIHSELNMFKNDPNRVKLVLRNYFASYEPEEHNCMSDDIKKIKRVLPDYPFIHINNELLAIEHKENRVQLVLKKYFDNVKAAKRSFLLDNKDPFDISPCKKLKLDENTTHSHSDINTEQVRNSVEKQQSSNETETESYTTELQLATDHVDQEKEINEVQGENCETASESSNKQELENVDDDQILNVPVEINDNQYKNILKNTTNSEEEKENSETEKKTLLSILSDLFPQYPADIFKVTCDDFGIDMNDPPNESTVDLVVNSLINYCSTEEYDADEVKITQVYSVPTCERQHSVDGSIEPSQAGSTEDFAVDEFAHFYRSTSENIGFSDNGESNKTEHSSQMSKELVQTDNLITQSSVTNISNPCFDQNAVLNELNNFVTATPELKTEISKLYSNSETEPTPTSQYNIQYTNIPGSSVNYENGPIIDFNTEIVQLYSDSDQITVPTHISEFNSNPIPSTSANITELSTVKIQANSRSPNCLINRVTKTYGSKKKVSESNNTSDILNFGSALLNNVFPELNPVTNMASCPGSSKTTKTSVATIRSSTNIIKPASFHPKPSTSSSTGNCTRSKAIIKPATFQPENIKTTSETYNRSNLASGIKRECLKINQPSSSGATSSFTSKKPDINKNTLRVRTDLYDDYFNGPQLQPSKVSLSVLDVIKTKKAENDDIILVSVDRLPETAINLKNPTPVSSQNTTRPSNSVATNESTSTTSKIQQKVKENSMVTINETSQPSSSKTNHPFYFKLLEIFPDISPDYLRNLCATKTEDQTLDDLISVLLCGDYKRRNRAASPVNNLDFEEQHKILQDLFPDADPTYLQHHCERLIDQPDNFRKFVASIIEKDNYPTKAEYLKKMKLSAQEKQYTTEFDVKKFLELIPNPEEFFKDPKRQVSFSNFDDTNYAVTFLKNTFNTTAIKDITSVFKKHNYSILRSAIDLAKIHNLKTKRKSYAVTSCKNIPLLQEIAYVKHMKEIKEYIKNQEQEKQIEREKTKAAGLMKTCQCCYDDEIMPDDTATCESGQHVFCKDCVRKGCEVLIGDGKIEFPCLESCESFFTLPVLQAVLSPKVFSKMAQRKQMAEVKSAGIEDLEFCPFCDFATIPAPGDKVFRCLNTDCMKESCRLCKEPSHIPLRCNEVEKDKDVKMRTYIEDKMTEALLRKCWKCGMKFIKESGCNKMTCSCGALMCYVCNQPVQDYKHFNGQGGDQIHLCPLYSDTHKLHVDAIKRGAETAKKELGVDKENQLKIDPTVDLEQHYRQLAAQNPAVPNVPVMLPHNILPRMN